MTVVGRIVKLSLTLPGKVGRKAIMPFGSQAFHSLGCGRVGWVELIRIVLTVQRRYGVSASDERYQVMNRSARRHTVTNVMIGDLQN